MSTTASEDSQRYQTILDSVLEGILTVDGAGKILDTNAAAVKTLGAEKPDLLGKNVEGIFAEPDKCLRHKLLNACIRIGGGALEYVYVDATGQRFAGNDPFPMELTVSPAVLDGEKCYLYIFRDVTHRRQLQNSLKEAQKLEAIAHLAGGVAHEINTPSQYIQDNLTFLKDGFRDLIWVLEASLAMIDEVTPHIDKQRYSELHDRITGAELAVLVEEVPDALRQSLSGIGHIARIVSSLRESAHPSGAEPKPLDLPRIIDNARTMTRNQWKHCAELEVCPADDLPPLIGHASEISQVLINLIINACHAMEEQGGRGKIRLSVDTKATPGFVTLCLEDSGPGVPDALADKIFNPFFTTKEVGKGTGQGLAISRDIICQRHQGEMEVTRSEALGGAAFVMRLPVADGLVLEQRA